MSVLSSLTPAHVAGGPVLQSMTPDEVHPAHPAGIQCVSHNICFIIKKSEGFLYELFREYGQIPIWGLTASAGPCVPQSLKWGSPEAL